MNEVSHQHAPSEGSSDQPAAFVPEQLPPCDVPTDVNSPEDTPPSEGPPAPLQVWRRNDSFISRAITSGKQGPSWQSVKRPRIINSDHGDVIFDEWISPSRPKKCYHCPFQLRSCMSQPSFTSLPRRRSLQLGVCLSIAFVNSKPR